MSKRVGSVSLFKPLDAHAFHHLQLNPNQPQTVLASNPVLQIIAFLLFFAFLSRLSDLTLIAHCEEEKETSHFEDIPISVSGD